MPELTPFRQRSGRKPTEAATYHKHMLRMPPELVEDIRELANEEMRSMNAQLVKLLEFAVAHYAPAGPGRLRRVSRARHAT